MSKIATKDKTFEIMQKYSINAKKRYGQNFLINPNLASNIVNAIEYSKDVGIIEIGPGIGALSEFIKDKTDKLVCIEIDDRLSLILKDNFNDQKNIKIINEDFLKIDLNKLIEEEFVSFKVVKIISNLPYYITSNIIEKLIVEKNEKITEFVFMMQKETGQKFIKNEVNNYLGFLIRNFCTIKNKILVSKNNFFPRPNVDSIVIDFLFNYKENDKKFIDITKKLFLYKRKAISNNIEFKKQELLNILEKLNIDNNARLESLENNKIIEIINELIKI